ncbi:MAG: hypothetical protein II839_11655 [Kiritimatiellae bacterium]|nr:hypothetical protein [Kiritimatiellia bacterium]
MSESSSLFNPSTITRYVAKGLCDAPQGRDGVSALARSAYAALLAAGWVRDDSAPVVPIHNAEQSEPSGDAFKAVYGAVVDAETQVGVTEMSAAGAALYTLEMPEDAYAGDTDCYAVSLRCTVVGDRYLDAGASVLAVFSDDSEPPLLSSLLGPGEYDARSAVVCATSDQIGADGLALAVPQRVPETESASVEFAADVRVKRYLHVALVLEDYFSHRNAWIEGGAMISPESFVVAFSRNVLVPRIAEPLDLGKDEVQHVYHTARADGTFFRAWPEREVDGATPSYPENSSEYQAEAARRHLSVLLQGWNYATRGEPYTYGFLQNFLYPGIYWDSYAAAFAMRSGVVPAGAYGALSLDTSGRNWWQDDRDPSNATVPCACRLSLFAFVGATCADALEGWHGPGIADVLSADMLRGEAKTIKIGALAYKRHAILDLAAGDSIPQTIPLDEPLKITGPGPGLCTVFAVLLPCGFGGAFYTHVLEAEFESYGSATIEGEFSEMILENFGDLRGLSTAAQITAKFANATLRPDGPWMPEIERDVHVTRINDTAANLSEAKRVERSAYKFKAVPSSEANRTATSAAPCSWTLGDFVETESGSGIWRAPLTISGLTVKNGPCATQTTSARVTITGYRGYFLQSFSISPSLRLATVPAMTLVVDTATGSATVEMDGKFIYTDRDYYEIPKTLGGFHGDQYELRFGEWSLLRS